MNSINNKTGFDDILFYNVITESMKKLFIAPCDEPFLMSKLNDSLFEKKGIIKVKSIADGIVKKLYQKNTCKILEIELENNIIAKYFIPTSVNTVCIGHKVKQGEEIAVCKDYFELKVEINAKYIFGN